MRVLSKADEQAGTEYQAQGDPMTDRDFWIAIRRALIMFIRAIEKRYDIKPLDGEDIVKLP